MSVDILYFIYEETACCYATPNFLPPLLVSSEVIFAVICPCESGRKGTAKNAIFYGVAMWRGTDIGGSVRYCPRSLFVLESKPPDGHKDGDDPRDGRVGLPCSYIHSLPRGRPLRFCSSWIEHESSHHLGNTLCSRLQRVPHRQDQDDYDHRHGDRLLPSGPHRCRAADNWCLEH